MFLTLLAMLAVWRVVHMLQDEEGPYGVFSRLQAWAARKPDVTGGINHGYDCFYCMSIWVSLPFALFISFNKYFIIYWLAISAGAVIINKLSSEEQ